MHMYMCLHVCFFGFCFCFLFGGGLDFCSELINLYSFLNSHEDLISFGSNDLFILIGFYYILDYQFLTYLTLIPCIQLYLFLATFFL